MTQYTRKPLMVWLRGNESACLGPFYFMVPGYPDSAYLLFENEGVPDQRIRLDDKFDIPDRDTIFFMYQVYDDKGEGCDLERLYTGPNRKADESGSQDCDKFASNLERLSPNMKDMSYKIGRRWCVAGWIKDPDGSRTDSVAFGFEDKKNGDDDFDDIVFGGSGFHFVNRKVRRVLR
jgi:hypothetical protein